MRTQYGKLNIKRRIEHHVGRLLEGEYPLVLGLTDALPLTDGLASRKGALVIVADNTAQQSVILRGNPVMIVERDARQRRYIYLLLQTVIDTLRQQRGQRMDTFDDEYAIAREA